MALTRPLLTMQLTSGVGHLHACVRATGGHFE